MTRSYLLTLCIALSLLTGVGAYAASSNLSNDEAGLGLRVAIAREADELAVADLGKENGFLGNETVRIELPEALRKAESAACRLGFDKQADELNNAMNHAAEASVLEAKPLLVNTIANMPFKDAKETLLV